MNSILLAGIAGAAAGGIVILVSHLAQRVNAGGVVRDLDDLRLFGRAYSRRESHLIGLVINAFLYAAAGVGFGALVQFGILAHDAAGLAVYILILTLVFGGVILPLEGHGLFGSREDAWFAIDLLIANVIWAMLFGAIFRLVV
jgi:hypothetical protein